MRQHLKTTGQSGVYWLNAHNWGDMVTDGNPTQTDDPITAFAIGMYGYLFGLDGNANCPALGDKKFTITNSGQIMNVQRIRNYA